MRNILFVIFTGILLLQCTAIHRGTFIPSAVITNANFKILGQVSSHSKVNYILGIGGFSNDGLIAQAKGEIYKNYNLPPGISLGNVTIDVKNSLLFLFIQKKITVTADVIDFNIPSTIKLSDLKNSNVPIDSLLKNDLIKANNKVLKKKIYKIDQYSIGDTVSFRFNLSSKVGIISAKFPDFDKVEVKFKNKSGKTFKAEIDVKDIEK